MFQSKSSHWVASIALLSTTLILSAPKAAQAFSFSVEAPGVTSTTRADATVIDFNTLSSAASTVVPVSAASSPLANSTNNGDVTIASNTGFAAYTNVLPVFTPGGSGYLDVGAIGPGSVQLDFNATRGLGYLGLFWGSPGDNDSITFTLRDANSQISQVTYTAADIFAGTGVADLANISDVTPAPLEIRPGRYVNFFSTNSGPNANKVIQSVLLSDSSLSRSFQVDNIAYEAIPTPALLPGLLGLGMGFWNKRRKQTTIAGEV